MVGNRRRGELGANEFAPALKELVGVLNPAELENFTIESIREHRRLLAAAEKAYTATGETQEAGLAHRKAYVRAMLKSKAQLSIVAVLVDQLGYIPDVPEGRRK